MLRKLWIAVFLFYTGAAQAQGHVLEDSLKAKLSKAATPEERIDVLGKLTRIMMSTNIAQADQYGMQLIQEAEQLRNRPLMVKALFLNGQRYSFLAANRQFAQKSIEYYNKALDLARQNKLDKEITETLLALSAVYIQLPDVEKSLAYTTQAAAVASTLHNDTLKVNVSNSYGNVYQVKKERLLALRNYLNALNLAEEMKNASLLKDCYSNLMSFYADIKDYDKAIDFAQKGWQQLNETHDGGESYQKVVNLFYTGTFYVAKKDFDMSVFYFEKSLKLADSLKYEPMKMPAYQGILGQYMYANQPQKALEYLNGKPELKAYISNFGLAHEIDRFYAVIYRDLGKFDSSKYYFEKAAPMIEARSTVSSKIQFYSEFAGFYKLLGNYPRAIEYYSKAKTLADGAANLEWQQNIAKQLDTMYARSNDFKQSYYFSSLYHQYKDSLEKLGEEKDMLQMETKDEEQRQARIRKEEEDALERKHTVQYMGIAIGIAVFFVLLVAMGMFKVSEATIKIAGFFAFIMLFEFIILLADTKIHHWTHGEPLPLLGIKIILIAMLLPLHHWLEHKVVGYLASRRLIIPEGKTLWKSIRPRKPVEH